MAIVLVFAALIPAAPSANAAVDVIAYWHMGENDPGAGNGTSVTNTINSVAGPNLVFTNGAAKYTNDVAPSAALRVNSTLSISLTNSAYAETHLISGATSNFGIEAWIKPMAVNGTGQVIAYNGNTSASGWGLILGADNNFAGLYGGNAIIEGNSAATQGVWTHVALVRSNATTLLFINGVLATNGTAAPNALTDGFAVGAPPQSPTSQFFTGLIDEVRVFVFAPGQFTTNDLLVDAPAGFAMVSNNLPNVNQSSVAWGDYDNDGHLDILISGNTNSTGKGLGVTQVWHNNGDGTFSKDTDLPATKDGVAAWGDYDNDGRLDILLYGATTNDDPLTELWHNDGSGFFSDDITANIPDYAKGSAAWGDYDNDGQLDVLVVGQGIKIGSGDIWHNNGNGTFSDSVHLGYNAKQVAWVDFDDDGRLDISIGGQLLHQNANKTFTAGIAIPSVDSLAWGDYDNDGRPDILTVRPTNEVFSTEVVEVWHNNGNGTFTASNIGAPAVGESAVAWGDFDNDGRLDILLTGTTNDFPSGGIIQLWHNNGDGTFSNVPNTGLLGISSASIACGDYDNDGRLDILISGTDTNGNPVTQLWRNEMPATNTPPQPPSGLTVYVSGTNVIFQWNRGSDLETPTAALTYNLRIGSASGRGDIVSPMSAANGFRRIPQAGNVGILTNRTFLAGSGTYYWSVQTVDNAFGASPFAPEQSFSLLPVMAPVNATNPVPGDVNGDGLVDANEVIAVLSHLATNGTIGPESLNLALQNYLATYPLALSNVDGLGKSKILFNLPGFPNANLSAQSSTDLVNWQTLGPVSYGFVDTNDVTNVQRFYRLSLP